MMRRVMKRVLQVTNFTNLITNKLIFIPLTQSPALHDREERTYWGFNVLQEQHRTALTLQQGLGPMHYLPDDLLQVSLLFKEVINHL